LVVSTCSNARRGRCAACKTVFDPDLDQGGNTNVVVRRDPITGDVTRALVCHWCRPGRPGGRSRHAGTSFGLDLDRLQEVEVEQDWTDTISTGVALLYGRDDAPSEKMIFESETSEPMTCGRSATRIESRMEGEDREVSEFFMPRPDGQMVRTMEVVYERQ
jgi:hypothetical protein